MSKGSLPRTTQSPNLLTETQLKICVAEAKESKKRKHGTLEALGRCCIGE